LQFIARGKVKLKGYCQNTFNLKIYIYIKKWYFLKKKQNLFIIKWKHFLFLLFFWEKTNDKTLLGLFYQWIDSLIKIKIFKMISLFFYKNIATVLFFKNKFIENKVAIKISNMSSTNSNNSTRTFKHVHKHPNIKISTLKN
jgi:hypothetical protein